MTNPPLLQVALDYVSLPPALIMAYLVAPEVDIIEIGTPLCKAAGLDAIRSIREICPDKIILADFKTPDVGGLEATIAFDAGADMITVIGGAALATVEQAYEVTRKRGKQMLMELTGVRDILTRAAEWRQIGVDRIVYHREWDAQAAGREWSEADKVTIRQLINMGYKVTVTGGINLDNLSFFADLQASVLISGRGIRDAQDPRAAARALRLAIAEIWSGSTTNFPTSTQKSLPIDLAAKAIRWGVSEMGLSLIVDGSNCPGCNSPARLCQSSRTDIHLPPGVDRQQFIRELIEKLGTGQSQAVGIGSPGSFYLDVGLLAQPGRESILSLLSATSAALQKVGHAANINAAINAVNNILSE